MYEPKSFDDLRVGDRVSLRKTITDLARARRQALIAMGHDPDASDVFPAIPTAPEKD